jgi:trans-aconitate methyltransferase
MNEIDTLIAFYAHAFKVSPTSIDSPYMVEERLDDLEDMQDKLAEVVEGRRVLEVACGTGYWTEILAETADAIVATDVNADALELAQTRDLPNTSWIAADARDLPDEVLEAEPDTLFAGSFWPYIPRDAQDGLIKHWRDRLGADTLLVLVGESYVEGVSGSVARTDAQGNTWQIQRLPDGSRTEVMCNFPTDSALRKRFAPLSRELRITRLEHYWMLTCRLK